MNSRVAEPEASWIPLSDADITQAELDAVAAAVCSPCLSLGPGVAAFVNVAHWFLYPVHLGTRFSKSSCEAIVEDLRRERIDVRPFCRPLHAQRHYIDADAANRRGKLFVTEKLADRALALPFHCHLGEQQIAFIVSTLKDASVNVGAGTAIYL